LQVNELAREKNCSTL